VHQAFELWFKQILWELDAVVADLGRDPVPEPAMGQVVHRLERIVAIQPLLVQQFHVLDTMTPLDFLDFRDELIPASGFQSVQWRLIENRLGLARARLKIQGAPYTSRLKAEHAERLERPSPSRPRRCARRVARPDAVPAARRVRLLGRVPPTRSRP
jgi:tryptophan 2,3-dioxygenase